MLFTQRRFETVLIALMPQIVKEPYRLSLDSVLFSFLNKLILLLAFKIPCSNYHHSKIRSLHQ